MRHINNTTGINLARSHYLNILNNPRPPLGNLTPDERAALRDLKSDSAVVLLTADKGKGTVIMNRVHCDKMLDILNHPAHFVKLALNPIPKSELELVEHLRDLKNKDRLSEKMYRGLFSSDNANPKIYGFPKVHKPSYPIRPIVSFNG